jgi:nucleoid DNA-binding protein
MAKKMSGKAAKGAVSKSKPATAAKAKPKRMTKAQIYTKLAEDTELTKKQITDVFEKLTNLIKSQISAGSVGEIVLPPGLLKIRRAIRPARDAREGTNPKTREKIIIPAQPEKIVIKARVLKTLSEMAS